LYHAGARRPSERQPAESDAPPNPTFRRRWNRRRPLGAARTKLR